MPHIGRSFGSTAKGHKGFLWASGLNTATEFRSSVMGVPLLRAGAIINAITAGEVRSNRSQQITVPILIASPSNAFSEAAFVSTSYMFLGDGGSSIGSVSSTNGAVRAATVRRSHCDPT